MAMTKEDVLRWIAGFEAVAEIRREEIRGVVPNPAEALETGVSLIDDIRLTFPDARNDVSRRKNEFNEVQRSWDTIRNHRRP